MNKLPSLSKGEIDFFNENGFVGPFKIYNPEEAKSILLQIRKKNSNRSKAIFNNSVDYDRHFDIPELTAHIGHPEIIGRIQSLLGQDILGWRTEFHAKFNGASGTAWHQVKTYQFSSGHPQILPTLELANEPYDLTVWTTFTESTKENGCMKFIPGSHKKLFYDENKTSKNALEGEYRSIDSGTDFYGYDFSDYVIDPSWNPDDEEIVALEMQPGECVIFTSLCVHGSYPNTTKRSTRFAIANRYVPTHTRVYPDLEEFDSHGSHFDLKNYATVLLSGEDQFHHNRVTQTNVHGEKFPHYPRKSNHVDIENVIISIWKKTLSINENITPSDNFFDLGGHSLHMMDIQTEINKHLNINVKISDLFEYPTAASLSNHVETIMNNEK